MWTASQSRIARSFFTRFVIGWPRAEPCACLRSRSRGQIVAMRLGFVVDDSLYLYYSGYDPLWARYSVMTTTVAEALKYAIACGLQDRQSVARPGDFEGALGATSN